jgi:RimJ/RimL family protein N-acetyltransferase
MLEAVLRTDALNQRFRAHFRLADATTQDAAYICRLRSDPDLNQHLNRSPADVEGQRRWLEAYKLREAAGREFYYVIVCDGADCGVVRMYDLRLDQTPTSFAWGSWIIPPPRRAGLVTFTALLIYEIGFDALGFQQAHFDVRRDNLGVVAFHLRAGARQVAEDADELHFVYSPEAYHRLRAESAERYADLRRPT